MGKWVYTNRSTPEELQRYLDDVRDIGAVLYVQGGYESDTIEGSPVIYSKRNDVTDRTAQPTVAFDTVRPKSGDAGFYCRNARHHYAGEPWVDQLPNHKDYTGLYDTDDVSAWVVQEL